MTLRRLPAAGPALPNALEAVATVRVRRADGREEEDSVAREEPLELRVDGEALAVTMRTPGQDEELAAGFLFTEGVIGGRDDLLAIEPCEPAGLDEADQRIRIRLRPGTDPARLASASRTLRAVAACGLCGKSTLDDIWQELPPIRPMECPFELLLELPDRMRRAQPAFHRTGGIHAAALFDRAGGLLCLREDIGRHNAVDKVVGWALLGGRLPLEENLLVVSGRAGFEIVQKAMMASIPVLVSVGAASNLASRLAQRGGLTLYSFVSKGRGNRLLPDPTEPIGRPDGE